jgi:hypothetical protein
MRPYTFLLVFLTSCAVLTPTTPIDTKPPLSLSDPQPLKMRKVEFLVIHKDNAEKTFSELEASGQEPVLFALTGSDYKSLAYNTLQIKGYLKNQRKIIRLYRKYYEGANNDKRKE